ncbi:MAG: flagellar hook-associated protein FlgK [Alphaproteobacteria bacterium]
MSTTLSLDSALSGLKAAQRTLDTISNNIANAQTAGFTRKILPQETLVVGGVGMGVQLGAVMRSVDMSLLRDLMKQASFSAGAATTTSYLDRIQDFHGSTDAERSLSARIGRLADAFSTLSTSPDNTVALSAALATAQQVADGFNDFAELLTQMRNDTEDQISDGVAKVNVQLNNIAQLNLQIQTLTAQGRSTAELEDKRDIAVRTVSQYIQISSFKAENNQMVVMTKQGQVLADGTARQLSFSNGNLGATSYYPGGGASGLFIGGSTGIEVPQGEIGGELGALFDLRDDTLPTYQAQADELAQKMAERFDAQGLRLFTDNNGNVPASVADPGLVGYVGFAGEIRVNQDVIDDPTLLRRGTYGQIVPPGSNEIIRKISEFAFGPYVSQSAAGTVDISAGDLFTTLGITQVNRINGTTDLTDYVPDLDAAPNITAPANFTIDVGLGAVNVTINPGDTAADLVNNINAAVGSTVASLSGTGQLIIDAPGDITFADVDIGLAGMQELGFDFTTYAASDPSFTVQVGTQSPVTISINSTDTSVELLAQLNAIPGVSASLGTGGELLIDLTQGGDLTLHNVNGTPLAAMGVTVSNVAQPAFRQNNLGPDGSLSTGLLGNSSLEDFVRSMLTDHAQDAAKAQDSASKEETFLATLDQRFMNDSGVNIDEEVAQLVRVQSAYTAAARMIAATEKLLDDLLNSI